MVENALPLITSGDDSVVFIHGEALEGQPTGFEIFG
jgi:hypothetical protein